MTQLTGLEAAMRSQTEPLAGLIDSYIASRNDLKPKSLRVYRLSLEGFNRGIGPNGGRINDLNATKLNAAIQLKVRAGHRHAARNLTIVAKLLSAWATETGIYNRDPLLGVKPPKINDHGRTPFTRTELDTIVNVAAQGRYGARDSALMLTMATSGIRLNEARELRVDAINWRKGTIIVQAETSKSSFTRETRLHGSAIAALDSYVKDWRGTGSRSSVCVDCGAPASVHLFLGAGGKAFTTNGFGHIFQRISDRLERDHGIKGFMAHRLRTTWASNYRQGGGGDLIDMQWEGGWSKGSLEMIRKHYDQSEGIDHLVNRPHPMSAMFAPLRASARRGRTQPVALHASEAI